MVMANVFEWSMQYVNVCVFVNFKNYICKIDVI